MLSTNDRANARAFASGAVQDFANRYGVDLTNAQLAETIQAVADDLTRDFSPRGGDRRDPRRQRRAQDIDAIRGRAPR